MEQCVNCRIKEAQYPIMEEVWHRCFAQ